MHLLLEFSTDWLQIFRLGPDWVEYVQCWLLGQIILKFVARQPFFIKNRYFSIAMHLLELSTDSLQIFRLG